MAVGKHRSNKRSSGGNSHVSTVVTVVFIGVCILGAWMFTSNSFVSPQKTTRTATAFDHSATESHEDASSIPIKFPTTTTAFEDNPGDLPNDAIKPDIDNQEPNDGQTSQPDDQNSSEEEKPNASNENEEESTINNDNHDAESANNNEESTSNSDNHEADSANSDEHKQDLEGESIDNAGARDPEHGSMKENLASVVDENPHGLQGKVSVEEEEKQQDHHTQLSEESIMTHQQAQEITDHQSTETFQKNPESERNQETKNDQQEINFAKQETHQEDGNDGGMPQEENPTDNQSGDGKGASQEAKYHISDEEQENRMENQQQQEEEQSQGGETSEDQVQHDEEAPIDSHSVAEETKTQLENMEGQHSSNQGNQGNQETKESENSKKSNSAESSFAVGESSSDIPKESKESKKAWKTQADQSENQKERGQSGGAEGQGDESIYGYTWLLCNETAGADFIPCLDNEKAISKLRSRNHYEHRERHCPEEGPTCLVPLPQGYKTSIEWPQSRDKIWYHNVPHTSLAEVKGHQNWVKLTGEFLTFPGGGTQFIHGALHYIDFVQEAVPDIAWGKHTRVVLDVGCGVASFGGYLFDRDVLTISLAPKDEHEAQVQFALERGIPAISAVMGTQRLQFPSRVFDLVHCARCRVPWHREGGKLLLELNRLLRPGGYFVWSATPVYQTLPEDVEIWKEMSALTVSMCWELVTIKKDKLNSVGAAIYRKPESNECYDERKTHQPPICKPDDDPNAAWYILLQACMHRLPVAQTERGVQWPDEWPRRLQTPPYWLNKSQMGIYGKPAPDDFAADYEHWKRVVNKSYMNGIGISWSNVRNVMDMRAVYGGFAAALKDLKVWVMNVVNIDSPDTLPIIYERGLFGIYHDWCESFSTYPRTYDLLHADHLFSKLKKRCKIEPVIAEVDRIMRPGGKLIVRDESNAVGEVENLLKSLHWEIHLTFSKNQEAMLSAQKTNWRPEQYAAHS